MYEIQETFVIRLLLKKFFVNKMNNITSNTNKKAFLNNLI